MNEYLAYSQILKQKVGKYICPECRSIRMEEMIDKYLCKCIDCGYEGNPDECMHKALAIERKLELLEKIT